MPHGGQTRCPVRPRAPPAPSGLALTLALPPLLVQKHLPARWEPRTAGVACPPALGHLWFSTAPNARLHALVWTAPTARKVTATRATDPAPRRAEAATHARHSPPTAPPFPAPPTLSERFRLGCSPFLPDLANPRFSKTRPTRPTPGPSPEAGFPRLLRGALATFLPRVIFVRSRLSLRR